MIDMLVKLDTDKILREKEYDPIETYSLLDGLFKNAGMSKDESGWYINGNIEKCGQVILDIWLTDRLRDNIKKWLWAYSDNTNAEELKRTYIKVLKRHAEKMPLSSIENKV